MVELGPGRSYGHAGLRDMVARPKEILFSKAAFRVSSSLSGNLGWFDFNNGHT
jgi:hypothetical protein